MSNNSLLDGVLARLVSILVRSTYFEDAAEQALAPLLEIARDSLAASLFASKGKILRAMIHLRPADGYRRLAVLEVDPTGATRATLSAPQAATDAYLPSATAWRCISERRCPVSIDVNLGSISAHLGDEIVPVEKGSGWGSFTESRERMLSRAATHVLVLPLRGPGSGALGMITVEAECRRALGHAFIWPECLERLQLLVDVASPYLLGLPPRPAAIMTPDAFLPVIGPTMTGLVDMLRVFARQDETILIGGPTGAGKSRMARWCHEQSPRSAGRFETLDLVTVPEELQMAELFGWRRGAFTGAIRDNAGSIARADRGTLFIDEIDKLSLKAQAGLLHVLEERTYRPLGEGAGERRADVRFVVGTNANLERAVQMGQFREDLYYRINVLPVRLPGLDERRDEIARWAQFMARRRHTESSSEGGASLSGEAERLLVEASWPGNLRQLDNIVRRAYALTLMEHGGAMRDVVLDGRHIERALGYEGGSEAVATFPLLERAAGAFVAEAERRRGAGTTLDLDLADAFRGLVLAAAVVRLGSRDEAFRLLGRESLLANRNHHKTLRRELERVDALCRALGVPGRAALADLSDAPSADAAEPERVRGADRENAKPERTR